MWALRGWLCAAYPFIHLTFPSSFPPSLPLSLPPRAVKAVVPQFVFLDIYSDVGFIGGMHLRGFIKSWETITKLLDSHQLPKVRLLPSLPSSFLPFLLSSLLSLCLSLLLLQLSQFRRLLRSLAARHGTCKIHTHMTTFPLLPSLPPSFLSFHRPSSLLLGFPSTASSPWQERGLTL